MQQRIVARSWAEHGRPEARVVTDGRGQSWIAYVGAPPALQILDGIPGASYVATASLNLAGEAPPVGAWLLLPATEATMLLLETVGKIIQVDEPYLALRNEVLRRGNAWADCYPPPPGDLPAPYQHQVEAFSECIQTFGEGGSGFNCWMEMGLGKSRWATDLLRAVGPEIGLVIYQKVTLRQWKCCLENVFPEATTVPLVGTYAQRVEAIRQVRDKEAPGTTVLMLNWEMLHKLRGELESLLPRLSVIIGDEITKIRNPAAQMSKAARKLAHKTRWRVGMTGSPTGGDPTDLWAQMDFSDPGIFGLKYWDFKRRYFRLGGFTGYDFEGIREDRLPEFIAKMYKASYRATKATVTDMPPKTYVPPITLTMGAEQRNHYRNVAEKYGTELILEEGGKGRLDVASAIARTTRLMQITAGVLPLTEIEVDGEVFGGGVKLLPSVKTDWCVEYAREIVETTDSKGILWTMFQAEADRLTERLREAGIDVEMIDGRVKDKSREAILERYLNWNSDLRWMVVNVAAGAYGLDLPNADIMVYHSSTYDPYLRMQSEDRGHRLGRVRPYQIIDLIVAGTVDEDIYAAYQKNMNVVDYLVSKGIKRGNAA